MSLFKFFEYQVIRWFTLFTCLFFLSCTVLQSSPTTQESRIALVMGNADYKVINSLKNPVKNAQAMSKALNQLGFEVIAEYNANKPTMSAALLTFTKRLKAERQRGQETVGLFYYSGHGAQDGNENFLLPVSLKASPENPNLIPQSETVLLSDVLKGMKEADNTSNIIILDASRNKPDNLMLSDGKGTTQPIAQGLAWVNNTASPDSSVPEGTLIAYATSPKKVAYDNSPYTKYLLEYIHQPGISIEELFKQVRNKVIQATGGRQTPWESSSLKGDFYFSGTIKQRKMSTGFQ